MDLLSYIILQNVTRLIDRGDALQWAASVSLSPQEVQEIKDQSIQEIVSKSIQTQVINALKNFTDIDQYEFLTNLLFLFKYCSMKFSQHHILTFFLIMFNHKSS